MATHTLGTKSSSTLTALLYATSLAEADVATLNGLAVDDQLLLNAGILFTATTNSTAALTAISPSGAAIQGMQIWGSGIPAGTIATVASGTTATLNQAATSGASGVKMFALPQALFNMFSKQGLLYVPNRGVLTILPGDYVAVDASGWPILVSKEAVAYTGSSWTFT